MYSKKGVSALIASVLMIVVVIGIGAVVAGVIRGYVGDNKQLIEKSSTDIQCSAEVQIDVPAVEDRFLVCVGDGYLNFTVENTGSLYIDDLQLKVFGSSGFAVNDSIDGSDLDIGMLKSLQVFYSGDVGTISEVHIIPKKKVTGASNRIYCDEAKLKFADISQC